MKIEKNINGKKYTFEIKQETPESYGQIEFSWKFINEYENKLSKDGFFGNAKLNKKYKVITFRKINLNGSIVSGIKLDDNMYDEIINFSKELTCKKERLIDMYVNKLVSGELKVKFNIVGCDYKYYDFDTTLGINEKLIDDSKFEIINKAMKILLNDKYANYEILRKQEIIKNHEGEEDFYITLAKVLEKRIKLIENKNKEIQKIIDKAKHKGEKQEINRYYVECNNKNEDCDCDLVIEYIDGNGIKSNKRIHTY